MVAVAAGGAVAYQGIQAGRRRLKRAIGRAEAIADRTRAALEETQQALHETRTAL